MFIRGKSTAVVKGDQLIITCESPKDLAKSLGFQYSPEFKTEMLEQVQSFLKLKGDPTIEQLKDKLVESKEDLAKRYLNILNEIKPQIKIDGTYYNYHVYHQGSLTMVELSKMHDLDEILYKKVKSLPDTKEVKKIQKKKAKLIKGGASYDTLNAYYHYNETLESMGKKRKRKATNESLS
jgi:hypothetical protein